MSLQKSIFEAMNKNINLQNISNAVHQDKCKTSEMIMNNEHDEQNQSSVPNEVPNVKRKRGRPRKIKNNSTDQNIPKTSKNDDTVKDISDIITEPTYMIRSKRNTSKIRITINASDLSDESDTNIKDKPVIKKRGRPIGSKRQGRGRGRGRSCRGRAYNFLDSEYVPKTTRKDVSQLETLKDNNVDLDEMNTTADSVANIENGIISSSPNIEKNIQLITCAKCNQQILKRQWSSHNLHRHNNMAWRENEEPLDFENDIKLLKKVLACALKQKKNYLTCEKCGDTKRSVNGFISHTQFCGKSEEERQALMMTCPICKSVMMPSSMEMHERYHRQLEQNKDKETSIILIERTKRKAAEKAVPKIFETMKEQDSAKKKLDSSIFKNIIQMPELKKKIPAVWKGIWRKEIASQGIASCKQVGCTYTCSSYESICEHYSQCNFIPQENFKCKICKFSADSKDKIISHITETHSSYEDLEKHSDFEKYEKDEDSSEEDVEFDVKEKCRSSKQTQINSDGTRIYNKMGFLDREIMQKSQSTKPYKPTLQWTLEFELKNYELILFEDNMPNAFTLLENNNAEKYLPELTISMAIRNVKFNSPKNIENSNNDKWKRLNRFEGDIYEAVPTFFVGGPVWALAWLPIPSLIYSKNPTQYIAISTHPTMESEYTVGNKYSGPNIIQIWKIGSLNHNVNNINKPILAYAITHNSGTIWCLEWCPSGCYQDIELSNYKMEKNKLKRMGLLAAACSDGCVNIYSLPFPDELKFEKTEYNSLPIYKTDPVMTLVVNHLLYDSNEQNWQCIKLSWTKEHGHNIIAAGFTNGYIALWDLTTTCPMLVNIRKNTKLINAFQHFFAHHNAVSMVALVPYGKSRFLASGSTDRSYKFWDLEDTSAPRHCAKKGIILDGAWMMHWPCSVMSFDDAFGYQYTHSCIIPLREYGYKYCTILPTNSPTYSISVSDYANSIVHGTLAGEVITIFPHQLLYTEKVLPKKRQLNSFIKTVDFLEEDQNTISNGNKNDKKNSKDYHYMPETYNECKDRFGIIFHDKLTGLKDITKDKPQYTLYNNKLTSIPIEQYPFTSANRVAWNPNAWSYLWLIVGYQNGLIRLLNLTFMSAPELNTLLSSHVEYVLAKGNNSTR